MVDSSTYREKKTHFDRLLTLYGRKAVLEALQSEGVKVERLHLSKRNKPADILEQIIQLATAQDAEIIYHEPMALSRISRNKQQDQGVAADLHCPSHRQLGDFLNQAPPSYRLMMLDGVTNPQNLGMILRSLAASPLDGLVYCEKENTRISPLVIKASAGAAFRSPILRCDSNNSALEHLKQIETKVFGLSARGQQSLWDADMPPRSIFVLGGESDGISPQIQTQIDEFLKISMLRGVESLNVAVTASLVAFRQ